MTSKQYAIGEFASINKVSARMLRHYDKIGLFTPSVVLDNGYRYYSSTQIPMLSLIKKYQSCGFTLAEIAQLLLASKSDIALFAKGKLQQFMETQSQQNDTYTNLLELSEKTPSLLPNEYVISYSEQPQRTILCTLDAVCEEAIEEAFARLYKTIEKVESKPLGLPFLFCGRESAMYRVGIQTATNTTCEGLVVDTLPAGTYLSTRHYGGYEDIATAYDRLLCYGQEEGYQFDSLFLECYLLDCAHTHYSFEYITEISIKITP